MAEQLIRTEYSQEMQKSYIDYAMSVIVSRALPDIRDGLKPVQRRTLYDMYELGIRYNQPYRKSARIVGDTMGKYHPHGDSSIYEALVVMAQDFKKGMPLVDGHGNFGSIEGDGAAAMRYTEARLERLTQEAFLSDLDKDIVDFVPNFDETEKEPEVLPVRVPNLLLNGAEGIAVGMATNIPTHNLGELIDGVIAYMKNPDINTAQMMEYIPGPDFPTGGIIANQSDLLSIYSTGTGKLRIRGKVEIEKGKSGRTNIVITEIPYTMIGSGIGKFLNDVFSLTERKLTSDITDISNQSSKEGIRIVIETKRGADVDNLINLLYKKTRLSDTYSVNMLSVCNGKPETLGIVPIIRHHVDFQYELATRKYTTLLNEAESKKEIQEGLIKACDVIDLIIEILRGSKSQAQARACMTDGVTEGITFRSEASRKQAQQLHFTERQADAILQMRLYRLIGLELEALQMEYEKNLKDIASYKDILENRPSMARVIIKDLRAFKKNFARERRTVIDNIAEAVVVEKPVKVLDVAVMTDRFAYVRCVEQSTFERNREAALKESRQVILCKSSDRLGIMTDQGQMHIVKVSDLTVGKFRDRGQPLDNVSNFDSLREEMLGLVCIEQLFDKRLLFVTANSMIKLVEGASFDVSKRTTASTKLAPGDRLIFAGTIEDDDTIIMESEKNMFLRIGASDVPEKKKAAVGVRGMKLSSDDHLRAAHVLKSGDMKTVSIGNKTVELSRLRIGSRDTKGVKR